MPFTLGMALSGLLLDYKEPKEPQVQQELREQLVLKD
jgi:hypothetical protein